MSVSLRGYRSTEIQDLPKYKSELNCSRDTESITHTHKASVCEVLWFSRFMELN